MEGLRRFFTVAIGIACAMAAAFIFLPLAALIDPSLRQAGVTIFAFGVFAPLIEAFGPSAVDPSGFAFLAMWLVALGILGAPIILSALFGEALHLRSIVYHMAAPGILAAAMPFIFGLDTVPGDADGLPLFPFDRLLLLLFLTGAVAGAIYWLVAGRAAGRRTLGAITPV